MDEATLQSMIAAGESATVEFKIKAPRPAELAERICGMANTRTGGVIIFGVADATGELVGVERPNDTIDPLCAKLPLDRSEPETRCKQGR